MFRTPFEWLIKRSRMPVMILDVDTGLIRGLSVAEDVPDALSQAVERALGEPAAHCRPGTLSEFWQLSAWVSWAPPNSVVNRV